MYDDDYYGVGLLAILFAFFAVLIPLLIVAYVLGSWFLMKIFDKAGVQGRWRAWVPVYNTLIFSKLGDLNPWILLGLWGGIIVLGWVQVLGTLLSIAAFVYTMLAAWRVGLKLQKEPVWLILYFFLAIVWFGINAFDRSRWNTAVPPAPWAGNFLADKTVWQGVPVQTPAGGYQAAPGGYQAASAGYPTAPAGYQPPAGYTAPPAPPAGYAAPPAPPAPPAGPAAGPQPPAAEPPAAAPPAAEPPAAEPPAAEPPAAEPPAAAPPAAEPPAAEPPATEPPAPEAPKQ